MTEAWPSGNASLNLARCARTLWQVKQEAGRGREGEQPAILILAAVR